MLVLGINGFEKEELTCDFPPFVPPHKYGRLFVAKCQVYTR